MSVLNIISIHSLVKRETSSKDANGESSIDFNPLPRKEGDRSVNLGAIKDKKISIHSLVKRETGYDYAGRRAAGDFNPLPRKEGDLIVGVAAKWLIQFQSTPS